MVQDKKKPRNHYNFEAKSETNIEEITVQIYNVIRHK